MRCLVRASVVVAPILLVPLLLLAGCSKKEVSPLAPVSGRVTLDNKPLPKAVVRFQPLNPPSGKFAPDSYGTTDEQGNFTLAATVDGTKVDGAVVGKHTVSVSLFDRDAKPEPKELVPARFNSQTELHFTVPEGGSNEAFLDLRTK